MASLLRQIVAGPRSRHPEAGLDLCYVTDFIIATSGPSGSYPKRYYRNPLDQLVKFLDKKHKKNWAIWEFRAEGTGYPDDAVYGRIWHYPWPDHHPPPFALMPDMMASMRDWLKGDDGRVVVVHCKAGKGRSGTASCSYLISEEGWNIDDALKRFTERRMKPGWGAGVSIPSQLRTLRYVDRWTKYGKKYVERKVEVCEVHVWGLRDGVTIAVRGFVEEGKVIKVWHTFTNKEARMMRGEVKEFGITDAVMEFMSRSDTDSDAGSTMSKKKGPAQKVLSNESLAAASATGRRPTSQVASADSSRVGTPTSSIKGQQAMSVTAQKLLPDSQNSQKPAPSVANQTKNLEDRGFGNPVPDASMNSTPYAANDVQPTAKTNTTASATNTPNMAKSVPGANPNNGATTTDKLAQTPANPNTTTHAQPAFNVGTSTSAPTSAAEFRKQLSAGPDPIANTTLTTSPATQSHSSHRDALYSNPQDQSATSIYHDAPETTSQTQTAASSAGADAIFTPSTPCLLSTNDINISALRRTRGSWSVTTSIAHVWFNTFFEGLGPEHDGHAQDSGVFEIDWEAMDGLKGSSRKGARAFDRVSVVWRAVGGGVLVEEPREGEGNRQARAADWRGVKGAKEHQVVGAVGEAGSRGDEAAEVVVEESSGESGDEGVKEFIPERKGEGEGREGEKGKLKA